MIELSNVTKVYGGSSQKAVDSVSLIIPPGKIFGFLGPNGAGKSTIIKMVTGVIEPTEGEVKVCGLDIVKEPIKAKQKIGYVSDNPELFSRMRAEEYLNFIGDVYGVDTETRKTRITRYTKLFEIEDVIGSSISSFSHGMKQKLLIVASLLSDPEVWILDEPMVGLDPKSSFQLKELMRERVQAGKTVFFSTHVMDTAEKICDTLSVIAKGKILFTGALDDLKQQQGENSSLEELFLELTENEKSESSDGEIAKSE